MMVVLFTSLAALSTLLGGLVALRAERRVHLLLGFGAGVMLGAVFFDLLPEAVEVAGGRGWGARGVLAMVALGLLGFYLLERGMIIHACPEGDCGNEHHHALGRMSAVALIAHSLLDGAAIGAATQLDWRTGLLVALAVVVHDASDGLNTVLLVRRGGGRGAVSFLVADAAAPVVGGLAAVVTLPSTAALTVFLAAASGFFLYTAISDLLPEAHRRSASPLTAVATTLGVVVVAGAVFLMHG